MPDLTAKSKKTKYIVIAVALALAGIGYLGYRSLLVKPEINVVEQGRRGNQNQNLNEVKIGGVAKPKDDSQLKLDLSGTAGSKATSDQDGSKRGRRGRNKE